MKPLILCLAVFAPLALMATAAAAAEASAMWIPFAVTSANRLHLSLIYKRRERAPIREDLL